MLNNCHVPGVQILFLNIAPYAGAHKNQVIRASDTLELELEAVVSCPVWVLGGDPGPLEKQAFSC